MRVRLSAPASPQLVRKKFSIAPTEPTVVNASPQVSAFQRSPGDKGRHAGRLPLQRVTEGPEPGLRRRLTSLALAALETSWPSTQQAAIDIGIDPDAAPSFDEVLVIHAERRSQMSKALAAVTDAELNQPRTASPVPRESEETVSVRECVFTVLEEHWEHRRYVLRDLAVLHNR